MHFGCVRGERLGLPAAELKPRGEKQDMLGALVRLVLRIFVAGIVVGGAAAIIVGPGAAWRRRPGLKAPG